MNISIDESIDKMRVILNDIIIYEIEVCEDNYVDLKAYLEIDMMLKEIREDNRNE